MCPLPRAPHIRLRRRFPHGILAGMACAVAFLTLTGAGRAWAAWSPASNVNTPASTAAGDQIVPRAVDDGAGGAIIVWADERGATRDIYALRLDRLGNVAPGWSTGGNPICTAVGNQDNPVIVSDEAGGAIIAWSDSRSGERDIYALRVNANGSRAGGWASGGTPVCTEPGDQGPVIAMADGGGGIYMVWRDQRNGNFDLFASRLRSNGNLQGGWPSEGLAVCTDPAVQDLPAMTTDDNGGFFVAWQDERNADIDIYATRIRNNGRIQGSWSTNGDPLCNATGHQFAPALTYDEARGFYAVWEDFRGGLTSDLYALRVKQNGNVERGWTQNGNIVCAAPGDQFTPQAMADDWGNMIVAWEDYRAGIDNPDIYVSKIRDNGAVYTAWPADGIAVCTASGYQFEPQLASDGDHGAILTWADYRAGPANADVYAKRIGSFGLTPQYGPANGMIVSNATGQQEFPAITGTGDVIVVWEDSRGGTADIYAQRIEVQGTLGTNAPVVAAVPDPSPAPPGFVRIRWNRPPRDNPSANAPRIGFYRVWRNRGARPWGGGPAPTTARDGAGRDAMGVSAAPGTGADDDATLRMISPDEPGESTGEDWQVVKTIQATGAASYTVDVPLPGGDGTPGYGVIRVEAVEATNATPGWMSQSIELWSVATADVPTLEAPGTLFLAAQPNPARSSVTLSLALPAASFVRVDVFAASGRRVRTVAAGEWPAGAHTVRWDRRDTSGRRVPAGIYFVRVETAGAVLSRRVAILD